MGGLVGSFVHYFPFGDRVELEATAVKWQVAYDVLQSDGSLLALAEYFGQRTSNFDSGFADGAVCLC